MFPSGRTEVLTKGGTSFLGASRVLRNSYSERNGQKSRFSVSKIMFLSTVLRNSHSKQNADFPTSQHRTEKQLF